MLPLFSGTSKNVYYQNDSWDSSTMFKLVGSHFIQPSKGNGLFYTGKLKFLLLYTYITI